MKACALLWGLRMQGVLWRTAEELLEEWGWSWKAVQDRNRLMLHLKGVWTVPSTELFFCVVPQRASSLSWFLSHPDGIQWISRLGKNGQVNFLDLHTAVCRQRLKFFHLCIPSEQTVQQHSVLVSCASTLLAREQVIMALGPAYHLGKKHLLIIDNLNLIYCRWEWLSRVRLWERVKRWVTVIEQC